MKYIEGVPVYRRCSKCARSFETLLDELDEDRGNATREFYEGFEKHDCRGSAQGSRITEEVTERSKG